ncbi:hypothetical protein EXN66_Car004919 [Channa argus]|uniref:Uncharacterized protein n=1 Tax=Channa argus TaxID=215402 RepID=A0A6G1PG83_CHAAH|nr:hypothetical protein EXN66_Car004919 [Channa argus]
MLVQQDSSLKTRFDSSLSYPQPVFNFKAGLPGFRFISGLLCYTVAASFVCSSFSPAPAQTCDISLSF